MSFELKKITVVGGGYVGLSLGAALAREHDVIILDIDKKKVDLINKGICPFYDAKLKDDFKNLHLKATTNRVEAIIDSSLVILALPVDFDNKLNRFNDSILFEELSKITQINKIIPILIKSTLGIKTTIALRKALNKDNIYFSPEFLREGNAYQDVLNPERIIVGCDISKPEEISEVRELAALLNFNNLSEDKILITGLVEAEAIKLFSNTYLALRVSYFNEVDSFALEEKANAKDIIKGICMDSRIGNYYNNPSFGYGGFCLPKDSKQLDADLINTPHDVIKSTIESNKNRKRLIVKDIVSKVSGIRNPVVGIYKLSMKTNSDNFRQSSILDLALMLQEEGIKIRIYEPMALNHETVFNKDLFIESFDDFKKGCDLIVTNRFDDKLKDVLDKVYTRDIFGIN